VAEPKVTDEEFIRIVQTEGPNAAAKIIGQTPASLYKRRRRIEEKYGQPIVAPGTTKVTHGRIEIPDFTDGRILVASDAHYRPGNVTTGHRAFVAFVKKYKPDIVVMNGDVLDAGTISRHPPLGYDKVPSIAEEISESQLRLAEIRKAGKPNARYIWPLGNHDARYEMKLASVAPELVGVKGTRLKDHFPDWEPCWSIFIGGERGVVIKHRFKGGIHATHNNVLWSGRSMVTGHLHSQKVTPFSDYNGTAYGADTGCLADPLGEQFAYAEDNPKNWRQGFLMLKMIGGRLLCPEMISVCGEGQIEFRGEVVTV
jgi:predicted phosphodiesterase